MDKEVVNLETLIENSPKKEKSKFNILKYFNGKNLKIIILLIVFVVALILIMNLSKGTSKDVASTVSSNTYTTSLEYSKMLESKLESVLSQVKGAGQVKVMITLDGSPELVYAMDSDSKVSNSSSGGTTTTSSQTPIIVSKNGSSSPLILTEILPKVKGVIVVSSGANDVSIKLDILNSVSTLLGISTDKINVLKGN